MSCTALLTTLCVKGGTHPEIRVMKVGKKQVTMGLFRQLPRDILLDPATLQLRGVPWGHVNYWWDGDGAYAGHGTQLHVVWQLGDVLKRAIVYETPHGAALAALDHQYQGLVEDWALLQVARAENVVANGHRACDIYLDKRIYHVNLHDHLPYVLIHYWGTHAPQGRGYSPDTHDTAAARYAELLGERGLIGLTPQAVCAALAVVASERDAYKARWAKQWQVLSMLPQLFIAV
jgi:hypothetical protein